MPDRWFYSHLKARLGPCSSQHLKDMADDGSLLRTDTVWKEGVEKGVLADKVKNLFLPAPPPAKAAPVSPPAVVPPVEPVVLEPVSVPDEPAPAEPAALLPEPLAAEGPAKPPEKTAPRRELPARKLTAKAGKGSVIVGQDGVTVKFRKKCTTCGHADSSWNTIPIRSGTMRAGFHCPKCRKHREVEIHGSLH